MPASTPKVGAGVVGIETGAGVVATAGMADDKGTGVLNVGGCELGAGLSGERWTAVRTEAEEARGTYKNDLHELWF